MLFRKEEKKLASHCSYNDLQKKYDITEKRLAIASKRGDKSAIRKEMKLHQKYEYALLYKNILQSKKNKK